MRTCALTGSALNHPQQKADAPTQAIVACPYGNLYLKEEAVLALMRRRSASTDEDAANAAELGSHIRGLKDLYDVRFSPGCTCPITGLDLSSGSQPCFVIVPNKVKKKSKNKEASSGDAVEGVNVLSEKAIKQMGVDSLQEEYGPFEERNLVRLAPPADMMEKIKEDLQNRRREEQAKKSDKKSKRKVHSSGNNGVDNAKKVKTNATSTKTASTSSIVSNHHNTAATIARATVASAVGKDSVLSSLFVKKSTLTEKEKKDKLMMTNGR